MSGRGVNFLEEWINRNLTDADRHGGRERARQLAARCAAEAAVLEISMDEMEPEWGPLEHVIYQAMQNDPEAELQFWKAFAAARDRK